MPFMWPSEMEIEKQHNLTEVDIDLDQPNILEAERVLREMSKLYHQAIQDLKWARKRKRHEGFQPGDEERVARMIGALINLGGAPNVEVKEIPKIVQ